jgi:hypothetical protein
MSDRQKPSYPTAPIAWMSQINDTATTNPTSSSPNIEHKSIKSVYSPTIMNNNTVTSMER